MPRTQKDNESDPSIANRRAKISKALNFLQSEVPTPIPAAVFASGKVDNSSASAILRQLTDIPETRRLLDPSLRSNRRMIYSNGLTIWMLIHQRLCRGSTLQQVVSHVQEHDRQLLPENKRTLELSQSFNTSAYNAARQRLKSEQLEEFSSAVCNHLASIATPIIAGRRVFIIDGTTITLAPTAELRNAFPPATNQLGETVWPVAMLTLASELGTGCVLVPQVDPMYGPSRSSEAKQCQKIVQKLPERSIVLADAGFGILSVAYHTRQVGHDFLFRLTQQRFNSYVKQAMLIESGMNFQSYAFDWKPTAKDRQSNPDLPIDTQLKVVLHCVQRDGEEPLYLVTSIDSLALDAANWYRQRYNIEFDIRDFKVTLDTENIRARSPKMMEKELLASVVAYNLTMQFRRQAAKLANVEPRRLSFTGCWGVFKDHLLLGQEDSAEGWQARYTRALIIAGQQILPQRKQPRSYQRKAHPRRPKSTKFMKKKTVDKNSEPTPHQQP